MKKIDTNFNRTFSVSSGRNPVCIATGKIAYATRNIAIAELHRIKKSYVEKTSDNKIPYRAYYCEYCGAWHLTSMTPELYRSIQNGEEPELEIHLPEETDEMTTHFKTRRKADKRWWKERNWERRENRLKSKNKDKCAI